MHTDNTFDCLAVTDVRVFPFKGGAYIGKIRALAEVTLNDQLIIRGLRVSEGENGLYLSYPVDPFWKGEDLRTLCTPTTRVLREHIENTVLETYTQAIEK